MYRLYLVVAAIVNLCAATEPSKNYHVEAASFNKNDHGMSEKAQDNVSKYVEKDENMLLVPALTPSTDEEKTKKKLKKSPKRTIQKIIKKNRGKLRKVYFQQMTRRPTEPPKVNYDKMYDQDDVKRKQETTTNKQALRKHKNRNTKTKVQLHHIPFQTLQKKVRGKDKRFRRNLSRELFILKDLDEIKFLSKEKDDDVVVAHITDQFKV